MKTETSFQSVIDRIAEAVSILDFSFIISGSLGYFILTFILHLVVPSFDPFVLKMPLTLVVICSIFGVYIMGVVLGSLGHFIRTYLTFKWFYFKMNDEMKCCSSFYNNNKYLAHNIDLIIPDDEKDCKFLYTQLWNTLSLQENVNHRLKYINRFWVMQKMYEGLFADFLVSIIAVITLTCWGFFTWQTCLIVLPFLVVFALIMGREANKSAKTQLWEIMALYYNSKIKDIFCMSKYPLF